MERQFLKTKKQNWLARAWKMRTHYSHHKTFGVDIASPAKNWLTRLLIQVGNTCTANTAVGMKEAMNPPQQYDPVQQWGAELALNGGPAPDGVTADTMMATGVKTGFFKVGETAPSDKELAWFTVTPTWQRDLFDNIKSALAIAPLAVALDWYEDWDYAKGPVPHTFNKKLGGHMTKAYGEISDIQVVNGVECVAVQGTWGPEFGNNGCFFFDRYMVNKCFEDVKYWAKVPIPDIERLGLLSALMVNLINLYHRLLGPNNGYPPPVPAHVSRIPQWAAAVALCEGANPKFCNPGNLKYSTLTASWGAVKGFQAQDGGWIAKFPAYKVGFQALCNFLQLGAENELLAFHQSRTLAEFTKIYAGNPPPSYLEKLCASLKVAPDIDISTLL